MDEDLKISDAFGECTKGDTTLPPAKRQEQAGNHQLRHQQQQQPIQQRFTLGDPLEEAPMSEDEFLTRLRNGNPEDLRFMI